jgi:hypothetical protein
MGQRHIQLLQEYGALIDRLSKPLSEDCSHFRPVAGAYSPYGVLYGFTSHLVEHMALKASQPDAVTRFSLEDVFVGEDANADKLHWVTGWRKLPHLTREVQKLFDYPQQFAEDMFDRLEDALRRRVAGNEGNGVAQSGRLFIVADDAPHVDSTASQIANLPVRYIGSSDMQRVAAHQAVSCDEPRLLSDRREGKYVLSYRTAGGWVAITKDILTDVLGAGRDAKIAGLPAGAMGVLKLMCPHLVILPENAPPAAGLGALGGSADLTSHGGDPDRLAPDRRDSAREGASGARAAGPTTAS